MIGRTTIHEIGRDLQVSPLGTEDIEAKMYRFLGDQQPGIFTRPQRLNIQELIDKSLPKIGIEVAAASPEEMGPCEGLCCIDPSSEDESLLILLTPEMYDALYSDSSKSTRARSTFCHELAHALLHAEYLRKPERLFSLKRATKVRQEAYYSPEWQAFCGSGCLLAPRATLELVQDLPSEEVAGLYGVSPSLMERHLKRLKLGRYHSEQQTPRMFAGFVRGGRR